jgi:hypothetical protein
MRGYRWATALSLCLALGGCKLKTGEELEEPDFNEIEDQLRDAAMQLEDLEICPGYTLPQLLSANSLTPECREELLSFLPDPEASFEGRLLAPGGLRNEGGELRFLLQGVDAASVAISADAIAQASVSVLVDGELRALESSEFSVVLTADLPTDLLSVSVVNDYSASMFDRDLRDVAEVEQTLFTLLPPIDETEVIRFSTEVETLLEFGTDAEALDSALAYDAEYDRSTTALIDGLGTSASHLSERERPVKILILSTDGAENASTLFEEADVLAQLDDERVFVIALGALLADVSFLRDLTRGRGVFVYTREFSALLGAVTPYLESLEQLIEVRIAELDPPPSEVRVELDGMELILTPAP